MHRMNSVLRDLLTSVDLSAYVLSAPKRGAARPIKILGF